MVKKTPIRKVQKDPKPLKTDQTFTTIREGDKWVNINNTVYEQTFLKNKEMMWGTQVVDQIFDGVVGEKLDEQVVTETKEVSLTTGSKLQGRNKSGMSWKKNDG